MPSPPRPYLAPPDWPDAACRQPANRGIDFFPPVPTRYAPSEASLFRLAKLEEPAMACCDCCSRRRACYLLARQRDEPYGIWGGVNFERRRIRRAAA